MKTVTKWDDLREFGIDALTGEACGLGYRLLCDLTERGRKILEKCLGASALVPEGRWNTGTQEEPHVGSVLLPLEMMTPLAVFALLESGSQEVFVSKNGGVYAPEPHDDADAIESVRRWLGVEALRRLTYGGTAGDRNIHQMTGRVT